MAGIKEAMQRVLDHRNEGICVAKGKIKQCQCDGVNEGCHLCGSILPYMIIQLDARNKADMAVGHGGRITIYDYGTDVRISNDINVSDEVILMIRDNWSAEWVNKPDLSAL